MRREDVVAQVKARQREVLKKASNEMRAACERIFKEQVKENLDVSEKCNG